MKRTLSIILVFCLVFTFISSAHATERPSITKQPDSAITDENGTVIFSIKTSGTVEVISWHFVSPDGNDVTGKKISEAVPGVIVKDNKTNGKSITLLNVPETMNRWKVYAHVNGAGYKVDSEMVYLYVYGKEIPPIEDTPINSSTFPDSAFRSYIAGFDTDNDGVLSKAEIYQVTQIEVSGKQIKSLVGIGVFISLNSLYCDNNPQLRQVDFSSNLLLKNIDCRFSPIAKIDLKKNRTLRFCSVVEMRYH